MRLFDMVQANVWLLRKRKFQNLLIARDRSLVRAVSKRGTSSKYLNYLSLRKTWDAQDETVNSKGRLAISLTATHSVSVTTATSP